MVAIYLSESPAAGTPSHHATRTGAGFKKTLQQETRIPESTTRTKAAYGSLQKSQKDQSEQFMGNSFFKCVRAGSRIVVTMRYPASHDVGFHATHAAAGRQVFDLDYRFALAPGVIPGIYAWPRQIAVRRAFEPSAAAR